MFGSLKKKLREGVQKLSRKVEESPTEPSVEERSAPKAPAPKPKPEKPVPKATKTKAKPRPEPSIEDKKPVKKEPARPTEPEPRPEPVREEAPPEPEPVEDVIEKPKPEVEVSEQEPEVKEPEPVKEEVVEKPEEEPRKGRLSGLLGVKEKVVSKELSDKDIDSFFDESELDLLQSDVALEVSDSLKRKLKEKLVQSKVRRGSAADFVKKAFEESLLEIVDKGSVNLEEMVKKAGKEGRPLLVMFLGFNGSGKTTTLAKTGSYLKSRKLKPVLAAGDTFRAASIEQLEVHGDRLGLKVIKHQYGSDSAAVIFDARKYAEKSGMDVVLADTAGRQHTDRNLMDELRKVVRVNNPDLKVLVVDSLTGNDAVEQARQFHEAVGVDCVVMTKTDVNPRGGSILSVVHTIGKPILFLGTGQEYDKVEMFDPRKFVKELME